MTNKVDEIKSGTLKNLRQAIQGEFGNSVQFQNHSKYIILVPDSLTKQELLAQNVALCKDLQQLQRSSDVAKAIDIASASISKEIKTNCKSLPWPCHPSEVGTTFPVPKLLESFLLRLLQSKEDRTKCLKSTGSLTSVILTRYGLCSNKRPV